MNQRIASIGIPATLALILIVCCALVATADTVTPPASNLLRLWGWY